MRKLNFKITCAGGRFIWLFLFVFCFLKSPAQSVTLSLNLKDKTIREVFDEIEKKSDFTIFYYDNVLDIKRKVSINVTNQAIEKILDQLFVDTDNIYSITGKQIVISKNEIKKNASESISREVSGRVLDRDGEPLIGATVLIAGTSMGMITDLDGHYALAVSGNSDKLIFSYLGYKRQEETVGNRQIINVQLELEIDELEELVVVGYGTMKKRDLTGSVASVKGEALNSFMNLNAPSALQGLVTGVHIQRSSGMPGTTMQVRIRGTNSIKGGSEPLWIIDGFPSDQSTLNVADIESIEVLKDASAAAIYGSRGSNGVIIITTKQARKGGTSVEYNGSMGWSKQIKKLDLMTASEYLQFMNEQQKIATGNDFYTPEQIAAAGRGTDWQDVMFRTGVIQNHSINVNGGNELVQTSLSGSYLDQEGIILANRIRKMSLHANINMNLSKKLKLQSNIIYGHTNWDKNDSSGPNRLASVIGSILGAPATITPYTEDGSYSLMTTDFLTGGMNPVAYVNEVTSHWYTYRVLANVALEYKPINELTIRLAGNSFSTNNRQDDYTSTKYPGSYGSANIAFGSTTELNGSATATYENTFAKKHKITAMLGSTYDDSVDKSASMSGSEFLTDDTNVFSIGSAGTRGTPSSNYSKWVILSFLGRLNYVYNNKYLATFTMRADGSSRYSKGQKWGYFPSGALAWRVSEEPFMRNIPSISNLKLRFGYGINGNAAISPYASLDLITSGSIVLNKDLVTFYRVSDTYQSALKWETSRQLDAGLDIGFFNDRLRLTADYYIKKTDDLLNTIDMPRSSGYTTSTTNIGSLENRGVEIQIESDILKSTPLKWDINVGASFNRNKVLSLYQGNDMYGASQGVVIITDVVHLVREGEPLGSFFGYVEDGYNDQGRVVYKDLSGTDGVPDGVINALDRTIIGNPFPDCILSFNTKWNWKNFQLSAFFYASIGNDIFSLSMAALAHDYQWGISTLREVLYDHWTPENPNAKYPNITAAASSNLRMSDRFVFDGSYLKMKNIELSYFIPLKKTGIKQAQVYVSGQDLLTFTKYPFWDVEINARGGSSAIEQGIDSYNYPGNKSITVGARLIF